MYYGRIKKLLISKGEFMINILQAIGSIGTFIMALLYLISVMVQIKKTKMSFIPYLAFDQITMEQEGKNLKLRNLTATHSDYANTAFKLQNLGGGIAKNIDIKVHLNENEIVQEKHINVLPSNKYYLIPIGKNALEEFQDTVKNNNYKTNMHINISYYNQFSKKQNNIMYRVNIEKFVNLNNKDLYELTFDTIDA